MKHSSLSIIALALIAMSSCRKESNNIQTVQTQSANQEQLLSIQQAKTWYQHQPDTDYLKKYHIRWQNAKIIPTTKGNRITVHLPGQPTLQGIKQGYRSLSIQVNAQTKKIEGKIIETLPDAIYFQTKQKIQSKDFYGRILEYDLNYHFQKGSLYADGKQIGESRPATPAESQAFRKKDNRAKIAYVQSVQTCSWYQTTYIDADGIFTVYTERICSTYYFNDGQSGYNDFGNSYDPNQNFGGGGGSSNTTTIPAPSNLPGEDAPNVDPKKMTKCFANIPDQGAAFQVKILVNEPLPGTIFNIGPNSFGHVAIQLTKVKGDQSITQILGFYPTGTGLSKLNSPSIIKDNSDIAYHMSASYFTTAENFQKILNYLANPPENYQFLDYNCTSYAYYAAKAGGLSVPDPTITIGAEFKTTGMTPAGMASALRAQKAANPNANISQTDGTAPAGKGECNEE